MNRALRHWWAILLLGGLLVLLGGSVSNSGAAPCNTFSFSIALPSTGFYVDRSASNSFIPTITAKACGDTLTSYKGPATLTASGTSTDGTFAPTGAAGITNPQGGVTFKQGVATPKLTTDTGALGVTLTVTDSTLPATGTSDSFNVFDKTKPCESNPCSDSLTKGPEMTVTVNLPTVSSGFLGLSVGVLHAKVKCLNPEGAETMGAPYTIAPPSGVTGYYTATVRYSKKEAPGTGVANFVHCFSGAPDSGGALSFEQVLPCNKSAPGEKCILDQRRNGVGDLIVTFQLGGSNDPGGTGFS